MRSHTIQSHAGKLWPAEGIASQKKTGSVWLQYWQKNWRQAWAQPKRPQTRRDEIAAIRWDILKGDA
ncbi:MAG: hypothetical protein OEV94_11000 [Deltaproteobacteria bacterium]|nr:hypothetical protein [Deltaproteobacteria bacterium]